jgi:Tfp pilus assembly protein PilF
MVALCFTVLLSGCQGEQEKARAYLKGGKAYYSAAQYQKAKIEFLNATQSAPDNPDAWFFLGETMTRLGNAEKAFQAYSRAEELDSDNPDVLLKIASLLILSNNIKPAEEKIEKILSREPENTKALFLKARILSQEGDIKGAKSLFEKIIALEPDHINALEKLSVLKTIQKDFIGAEQLLIKALTIDETAIAPRMVLAGFYTSTNAFDKAEEQLLIASRMAPDNSDIAISLGNFYLQMENEEAAENAYNIALEIDPGKVKPHMAAAHFYDAINRKDKALEMCKRALALEPDSFFIKSTLGGFYLKNGEIQEATALVTAMLEARPGFFPGQMLDNEIKIYKNSYEEALKRLQILEKDHPDSARLHYLKGLCHQGLGENHKAIAALARSVDLDPGQTIPQTLLAQLYYDDGEFILASQTALVVLSKNPTNFQAIDILANCDMEMGKQDKAREGFKELIEMAPDNPRGYKLMGLLFAYEKKYDLSNLYLHKPLERTPFAVDEIRLLIQNHIHQNDIVGAQELILKQQNRPDAPPRFMATLYKFTGDLWITQQNQKLALASFQKALEADPEYPQPYYAIARIQIQTGNQNKAIEQYTRLLEKDPGQITPHMMLAILKDASDQHDAAVKHYQMALDINPRYGPAANNLAYHLIQRTDQVDQALSWARVARESLPDDPAVMDTLGIIYLKKGLVDSAIAEFRDSLKRSADNPAVLLHLGQAYLKNKDFHNAGIALKKVLALDQDQDRRAQAAELINHMNE